MENYIAERELLYSPKGDAARKKLVIKISAPYLLEQGSVSFEFTHGTAACKIRIEGLPHDFVEVVYGADSVQALALATDVGPYLKSLRDKYDIFYVTGEPYFDE